MKRRLLSLSSEEFLDLIRREVKACGTQKAFADKVGVTQGYINDILKKKREPGPKILDALGFRKVIIYEVKE